MCIMTCSVVVQYICPWGQIVGVVSSSFFFTVGRMKIGGCQFDSKFYYSLVYYIIQL